MHHRDRLTALNPQSVPMRTLLHLVEQRRRVVDDKTRFTNRLATPSSNTSRRRSTGSSTRTRSCLRLLTDGNAPTSQARTATSVRAFFRSHTCAT